MMRGWVRRAAVITAGGLVLVLMHGIILTAVARFMILDTSPRPADLIVPFYFEPNTVPAVAADLLRRGYASRIGLYRQRPARLERLGLRQPNHTVWRRILEAHGVPPEAIVEIGHDVASSASLADAIAGSVKPQPRARILLLVTAPRSRIVRNDLREPFAERALDIDVHAVPTSSFTDRNWWTSRDGTTAYFDAYVLWVLRFIR